MQFDRLLKRVLFFLFFWEEGGGGLWAQHKLNADDDGYHVKSTGTALKQPFAFLVPFMYSAIDRRE